MQLTCQWYTLVTGEQVDLCPVTLNSHTQKPWLWTSSCMRGTLRANGIISECQKAPLNLLLLSDQPGVEEGGAGGPLELSPEKKEPLGK